MQFKYVVLIAWFVGLLLFVGGWYLKDTREKCKLLWEAIFTLGLIITVIVFVYLMFGVIAPEIKGW